MNARQLFLGSALALSLLAPATTVIAGEGCGREACKDFSTEQTHQIGAWSILTGSHAENGQKEYLALNLAQGQTNQGLAFSCNAGTVTYALFDGQPHAPGQSYKVTFTVGKIPPQTLPGETTGDPGVVQISAGSQLIEAISTANGFKIKAARKGESRELTFTNADGREALLTWGRLCGIHE